MRAIRLLGVFLVASVFLLIVPIANAHSGLIAIHCNEVTFTYTSFPNHTGNTVSETVTVDGSTVASPTFTFDGPSGTHSVPISLPDAGQHQVAARAAWNTNGETGSANASQALSGCTQPTPCPGAPNPADANVNGDAYAIKAEAPFISVPKQPLVGSSQSGVGADHAADELASVEIPNLVRVDALLATSDSRVSETPSQAVATSTAETARINLFNGAIKADVVRATAEAIARGDGSAFNAAGSGFVNLTVNGTRILRVRPNLRIGIPSIGEGAYVVLFERLVSTTRPGGDQTSGGTYGTDITVNMIHVHIPPARRDKPPVDVIVSHARAHADFPQTPACTGAGPSAVSGHAFVLSATVQDPDVLAAVVGFSGIPSTGGAGSQSLADVFLPGVVTAHAASSRSVGTITPTASRSTSQASIAKLNLFDGQILATIVQSQSNSRATDSGRSSNPYGTEIIDITIAGRRIANNPPANKSFEIPRLGYVVFNEQFPDASAPGHTGLTVRALHVHVNKLSGALPGADVIVAESHSDATH